jgi:hypothetical protein
MGTNNGFGPNGYSQYFKFAVEGKNLVIVGRSANGIVNQMNGTIQNEAVTNGTITTGTIGVGSAFVDPGTLTDRGYPLYTASQAVAYEYISNAASGNPDLRSLYSDPAVPWAVVNIRLKRSSRPKHREAYQPRTSRPCRTRLLTRSRRSRA